MDALITVSDTHVGSLMGLCPSTGLALENGAIIQPSKFQNLINGFWKDFWYEYVPAITHGARWKGLVHNGDLIDGNHHEAVDLVPNVESQEAAGVEVLKSIVDTVDELYVIRGTEAHSGKSGQSEERIAKALGATPEESTGNYSRQEMRLDVEGVTFHFAHHIGGTSSFAYETSAPMRELTAIMIEESQWGTGLPDVIVRSHRHRYTHVSIPTKSGNDILCVITPAWQLKTGNVYRSDRVRMPHIGGIVFTLEDKTWKMHVKLYPLPRPAVERPSLMKKYSQN